MQIKVKRLPNNIFPLPRYETEQSAGFDLIACLQHPVYLDPAGVIGTDSNILLVPTGLAIALPPGFEAQIRPRSGLAAKYGVTVLNSPGTIDADYRGEVKVLLINHGVQRFKIEPGMRIAQMVVAPVAQVSFTEVEELDETERGAGGFGSTGTHMDKQQQPTMTVDEDGTKNRNTAWVSVSIRA